MRAERKKDNTLGLEQMNKEYANLVVQYRQAVMDYAEFLKKDKPEYQTVPKSAFWGDKSIAQTNASTLDKCMATCSSTKGCTGATYNAKDYKEPMCWIRGDNGKGALNISTNSKPNDVAIVDKGRYLSDNIDRIGKRLQTISVQVKQLSSKQIGKLTEAQKAQGAKLEAQYHALNDERKLLMEEANDHLTLEDEQAETAMRVKQSHYWYVLAMIVFVVVLFVAIRASMSTESPSEVGANPLFNIYRG